GILNQRYNEHLARHGARDSTIPLPDGNDALGARLRLIETAQHTLDLQYFLIKPDEAGALISVALLEAASRNVRVRLLLDDAFTTAKDGQLAVLDSHPNIEVRIFNPLSRNSWAPWNYVIDFKRVNRRMHNKALIADNAFAIIGGRNLADEYYQLDTSSEFADFDMGVIGPSVPKISESFDVFWNDVWSVPVRALDKRDSDAELSAARFEIENRADLAEADTYRRAVDSAFLSDLRDKVLPLKTGVSKVTSDTPAKLRLPPDDPQERIVAKQLFQEMAAAKSEVILFTPYFVPRDYGAQFFEDLAARGIKVRIITNSLAATNHAYVHGGYYRHRKALLAAGVELFEVRADAPEVLGLDNVDDNLTLTMHTKAAIIDREKLFVGSLNFDPRSIEINTEFGFFLQDPVTAEGFAVALELHADDFTFWLGLDENDDVIWRYTGNGADETYTREPGAGIVDRATAIIARWLPVEGQL
ncbi:MAG: phospholipase D family protein, partial [Pseudoruegeria sp.]